MSEDDIAKAVQAWAEPRHLDRSHLERWLALDPESAASMLDAASPPALARRPVAGCA